MEYCEASAYWWKAVPNFGDRLTPLLLAHHADLAIAWAKPEAAQIVVVGSILEQLPAGWQGYALGAGKLHERSEIKLSGAKRRILALRGPLSAKGIPGDYALGDAGLLADELIELPEKKHELGIVAHWSDTSLASNPIFARYDPVIINPRDEPLEVVKAIAECRKIVSSSLHGIILADAFAIPRRFEYTPQFDREGGTFKFRDYSASIRTPFVVGKAIIADRFGVDDCRFALHDAFRELATRVRVGL